jgi:hypothetical protein
MSHIYIHKLTPPFHHLNSSLFHHTKNKNEANIVNKEKVESFGEPNKRRKKKAIDFGHNI